MPLAAKRASRSMRVLFGPPLPTSCAGSASKACKNSISNDSVPHKVANMVRCSDLFLRTSEQRGSIGHTSLHLTLQVTSKRVSNAKSEKFYKSTGPLAKKKQPSFWQVRFRNLSISHTSCSDRFIRSAPDTIVF